MAFTTGLRYQSRTMDRRLRKALEQAKAREPQITVQVLAWQKKQDEVRSALNSQGYELQSVTSANLAGTYLRMLFKLGDGSASGENSSGEGTVTDQLGLLAELHLAGSLTDAEFAVAKERVLRGE
jgi:hypothetical protein